MMDAEPVVWTPITTTRDHLSDVTETRGAPAEVLALIADGGSDEPTSARQADVVTSKKLYLLDVSIQPTASDEFVLRGETYRVDGDPHRWGASGVEVTVRRAAARP